MNYREAFTAAIQGDAVRAVDMAEGTYIKYDFTGMRIFHPNGAASSGWSPRDHDMNVDWEVVPNEHEDAYLVRLAEVEAAKKSKWGNVDQALGRALREVPAPPVVVKDWALDPAKTVLAVPPPTAADPWGRQGNVGSQEPAPKRDSWGRLIPD